MRRPKPYRKKSHKAWHVNIDGHPVRLASEAEGETKAYEKYYEKMDGRQPLEDDCRVCELLGRFLATYRFYARPVNSFARFIGSTFRLANLKTKQVYDWIDTLPPASDNYRRNQILMFAKGLGIGKADYIIRWRCVPVIGPFPSQSEAGYPRLPSCLPKIHCQKSRKHWCFRGFGCFKEKSCSACPRLESLLRIQHTLDLRGAPRLLSTGKRHYNGGMNAICLAIDRLSSGYVGAYGNTWIDTPALDRLACEGIVFDHAWSESPRLEPLYGGLWQGVHPVALGHRRFARCGDHQFSLAQQLFNAGVSTTLLTDERAMLSDPLTRGFQELVEIRPENSPVHSTASELADSLEHTRTAACFARIVDWLRTAHGPFLLWCHLSGLGSAWDAPYDFRRQYAEEGDPWPPTAAAPPELMLEEDYDPDVLLGITQSYAGQVSLVDACIAALMQFIDESGLAADTLLAITSPRGYPLGEHRRVGPCDEPLYGELLHVPLLVRFPDRLAAAARSQALVTPADLGSTLLDWWGLPAERRFDTARSLLPIARGQAQTVRDRILAAGIGQGCAVRVPAWLLRMEEGEQLFAKPFDRWEFNNVADRCQAVVAALRCVTDEFRQHVETGQPAELSPLEEVLIEGLA